jgi:hypothetical protein
MLWALLDETRQRRSGVIAGAAAAVWLNISVEGLPVVIGAGALLCARWLMYKGALPRLQTFAWALASGCVILETLTVAQAWTVVECDRISSPYMFALGVLGLGFWACGLKGANSDWRARGVALLVVAVLACGVFALQGPQCLSGPVGALDPLTKMFWLDNVAESYALWELGAPAVIGYGGYAAFGCVGAAWALRECDAPEDRLRWLSVLTLCVVASAFMLLVARAGGVAHAFATVGVVYIAQKMFVRVRKSANFIARVFGTALALLLATPAPFQAALSLQQATAKYPDCQREPRALNALPAALIFAPLDIGPEIIAHTPHAVVATGHHRNHAAMHDVISAFIGDETQARGLISSHKAQYVLLCPTASEVRLYRKAAPQGFAAQLANGKAPAWLERVPLGPPASKVLLYRVRP